MINLPYVVQQFALLNQEEQAELFYILTEHKELFYKLFPDVPLLLHILDPENGVSETFHGDIIRAYNAWAKNNQE